MKTANFGAPPSAPGAFTVSTSAQNYWTELAGYCYAVTAWNKSQAGMQIVQPETDDYSAIDTATDTFLSDVQTWLADLPTAPPEGGNRGLPAVTVPSFGDIVSSIVSLSVAGAGGVPAILLRVAFQVGVNVFASWLQGRVFSGSTPDYGELYDILSEISSRLVALDAGDNELNLAEWVKVGLAESYNDEGDVTNQALIARLISEGYIELQLPNGSTFKVKGIAPVLSREFEPN